MKKTKSVELPTSRLADYDQFSKALEDTYNKLDEEGYEVVNILPLNLGTSEKNHAILSNGNKKISRRYGLFCYPWCNCCREIKEFLMMDHQYRMNVLS
ncbi:hypothetical protein OS42_43560 [Dickeya oryzae]